MKEHEKNQRKVKKSEKQPFQKSVIVKDPHKYA